MMNNNSNAHDGVEAVDQAGRIEIDEGDADQPFTVASIPLQYDDGEDTNHSQRTVERVIVESTSRDSVQPDYLAEFHEKAAKRTKLSSLRRLFENDSTQEAMRLLERRRFVAIDDEFKLDPDSPETFMHMAGHALDYVMYMGNRLGLDAALPNVMVDHRMEFRLNLCQPQRLWSATNTGDLPFNPMGRLLCIGTRNQEDIWLAMVPKNVLRKNHANRAHRNPNLLNAQTSAMKKEHYYMICMFVAHALHQMRFEDLHCRMAYPQPLTRAAVKSSTEILGRENERQRIMHLTLEQFRNLHRHFRDAWSDWVNNAPQEWKVDGFLVNNTPVAITLRYGQNQMLRQRLDDDSINQERRNWELDHDYTNILTFTFSLASHVTFSHVTRWRNVPPEEIVAKYGRLFTAPPGDRNRTEIDDLANFPFMQDDGTNVVSIYTEEGYVAFRRVPQLGHSDLGGALLNLSLTPQLFLPPDDEEDFVIRAAPCSLYPLAFSKTLGNMQASDGLIYSFKEPLRMINEPLQAHLEDEDDSQDDGDSLFEEDDHPDRHRRVGAPVLRGLRCQGYNTLSHRVRNQSKFHAVQLGKITSAISGTTAVGFASIAQWTRRVQECRNNLPHEAFHLKVHGENQPQAMRMENTYQLDVSRMKAEDRNGRAIYDNVITPLLRSWTYATVRESLKQALVPFKRDIIPQMFEWMTFPVTSFLKLAWSKLEPTLDEDAIIEPYLIEMISMFERALNYGHTGAARVLARTLMDRTWLSLGLIFDGLPSLSGRFISHGDLAEKSIKLYTRHWPMDVQTNRPKTSSRRAQELTYGNDHYEAYIARFQIIHATKNLPEDVYTDMDHPWERLACYAAEIGMRVYIADITTFVEREISREIAPALRSDDLIEQTRATPRKRALDRWVDYEFPLSYSEATVTDLMRAVSDHRDDDLRIVGADIGKQSLSFFVEKVIAACKPEVPRRRPPFIQQGRALSVIKMVISHIVMTAKTARIPDADVELLIVNAFLTASRKLRINHVPWVANRVGQVGNPGTLIDHTVWLSLGAADPPRAVDCATFRTPEENTSALIRQSSQRLIAGDPTGEWSAIKVRLSGFHTILHKTVLPVECTMSNVVISSGSPSYVGAMYGWVLSNFNVSKPIHFLALFCSIAFAGLLPSVHSPPDRSLPANTRTVVERSSYMKNLDWIEKNKKGATEAPPFILMFITYVLGFYETNSPVGRLVNDPKGDCRKWLEKNTAKGMSILVMCRFGLADPATGLALRSGKWKRDVTPLSEEVLARKCAKVKDHLTSKSEYGAFDAVEYLAGTKTAQLLARNQYLKARPCVQLYGAAENSGNQNKRASNAWQAEEPSTSYAEASGSRTYKRHRLS